MKDPLQPEKSPYEILQISRGAGKAQIETAFLAALQQGVAYNEAKNARDTLILYPEKLIWYDLMEYNDRLLSELDPALLEDSDALLPERRLATARAWERRLKKQFPHLGLVHSLGVLWYWWSMREELVVSGLLKEALKNGPLDSISITKRELLLAINNARGLTCNPEASYYCEQPDCWLREGCSEPVPPLREMWERAIACWGMLLSSPEFWTDSLNMPERSFSEARKQIISALQHNLNESALRYTELFANFRENEFNKKVISGLSGRYRWLSLALVTELECADSLRSASIRSRKVALSCGSLMLQFMGVLDTVRSQVKETMAKQPGYKPLQQLDQMLSPQAPIRLLLERNQAEAALAVIDQFLDEKLQSDETWALRFGALRLLAQQQTTVGDYFAALKTWECALLLPVSDGVKSGLREELVSTIHARVILVQNSREDEAICLLEKAYPVVADNRLKSSLAFLLKRRGIRRVNDVNRRASGTLSKEEDRILEDGLKDLQRASDLGNPDAGEQLPEARKLAAHLRIGGLFRDFLS
jgi:hypothetical protein